MVDEPGEPEVAELGVEGRVQHHVAGLDVPMYHTLLPLLVQVEEGRPQAQHDLVPERPWQKRSVAGAVEVLVEAAVGHHLVDEEQLAAAVAPADELHQVAVPEPADDLHLRGVLLPPLLRALGHPLDGDVKVHLLQESSVHRSESSFPELPVIGKVAGGNSELAAAEPLRSGPFLELVFHLRLLVEEAAAVSQTQLFLLRFLKDCSLFPPSSPEKEPYGEAQNNEQG